MGPDVENVPDGSTFPMDDDARVSTKPMLGEGLDNVACATTTASSGGNAVRSHMTRSETMCPDMRLVRISSGSAGIRVQIEEMRFDVIVVDNHTMNSRPGGRDAVKSPPSILRLSDPRRVPWTPKVVESLSRVYLLLSGICHVSKFLLSIKHQQALKHEKE